MRKAANVEKGGHIKPSPDWKGGGAKPPQAGRSGSGALESGIKLGSAIFARKFSFENLAACFDRKWARILGTACLRLRVKVAAVEPRNALHKKNKELLDQFLFDCVKKLVVGFEGRDCGVVGFDLVGAFEEEACLACLYHAQVVVAVAGCDCLVAD